MRTAAAPFWCSQRRNVVTWSLKSAKNTLRVTADVRRVCTSVSAAYMLNLWTSPQYTFLVALAKQTLACNESPACIAYGVPPAVKR